MGRQHSRKQTSSSKLCNGVCLDKKSGGLRNKDLVCLDKELYPSGVGCLLRRERCCSMILLAKFGEQEGQRSSFEVRESYGVGVWKTIHKWWPTVIARSLFVVGNGRGEVLAGFLVWE